MDTQTQKLMFSSKSNEWETPPELFAKLNQRFKFTLDPCATHENHKCKKYYTSEDDGLSKSWENETVFVLYFCYFSGLTASQSAMGAKISSSCGPPRTIPARHARIMSHAPT